MRGHLQHTGLSLFHGRVNSHSSLQSNHLLMVTYLHSTNSMKKLHPIKMDCILTGLDSKWLIMNRAQLCSIRIDQNELYLIRNDQNWLQLIRTCWSWSELVAVDHNWLQLMTIANNWLLLIENDLNQMQWITIDQAWSAAIVMLFWIFKTNSCERFLHFFHIVSLW